MSDNLIVAVLGPMRSGTSLIMRIVEKLGFEVLKKTLPRPNPKLLRFNPYGFYEWRPYSIKGLSNEDDYMMVKGKAFKWVMSGRPEERGRLAGFLDYRPLRVLLACRNPFDNMRSAENFISGIRAMREPVNVQMPLSPAWYLRRMHALLACLMENPGRLGNIHTIDIQDVKAAPVEEIQKIAAFLGVKDTSTVMKAVECVDFSLGRNEWRGDCTTELESSALGIWQALKHKDVGPIRDFLKQRGLCHEHSAV